MDEETFNLSIRKFLKMVGASVRSEKSNRAGWRRRLRLAPSGGSDDPGKSDARSRWPEAERHV